MVFSGYLGCILHSRIDSLDTDERIFTETSNTIAQFQDLPYTSIAFYIKVHVLDLYGNCIFAI